jgi:hypothetical protein
MECESVYAECAGQFATTFPSDDNAIRAPTESLLPCVPSLATLTRVVTPVVRSWRGAIQRQLRSCPRQSLAFRKCRRLVEGEPGGSQEKEELAGPEQDVQKAAAIEIG